MADKKGFILKVIKLYRDNPCLWKTTDRDYHNKNKRNLAHEKILKLFHTVDVTATKETVIKKINSMRGSFRKELNKIRASERSGAGSAERHVPKLWYYDQLIFLEGQDVPQPCTSISSLIDDMPFGSDEEDVKPPPALRPPTPSESSSSTSEWRSPIPAKKQKIRPDDVLAKIARKIDGTTKPPFTAYGEHIGEKLRAMTPNMAVVAQKLINDVLFLAETEQLTLHSSILNGEVITAFD